MAIQLGNKTDGLGRQVAIVTGGGRGLGRAFAQALANVGAIVAITARTEAVLTDTVYCTICGSSQCSSKR